MLCQKNSGGSSPTVEEAMSANGGQSAREETGQCSGVLDAVEGACFPNSPLTSWLRLSRFASGANRKTARRYVWRELRQRIRLLQRWRMISVASRTTARRLTVGSGILNIADEHHGRRWKRLALRCATRAEATVVTGAKGAV